MAATRETANRSRVLVGCIPGPLLLPRGGAGLSGFPRRIWIRRLREEGVERGRVADATVLRPGKLELGDHLRLRLDLRPRAREPEPFPAGRRLHRVAVEVIEEL